MGIVGDVSPFEYKSRRRADTVREHAMHCTFVNFKLFSSSQGVKLSETLGPEDMSGIAAGIDSICMCIMWCIYIYIYVYAFRETHTYMFIHIHMYVYIYVFVLMYCLMHSFLLELLLPRSGVSCNGRESHTLGGHDLAT